MNRIILGLLLLSATMQSSLQAQGCCGIGSALVAGGFPSLRQGSVLIQFGGDYSSAANKTDKKALTATIGYGITNRLALSIKSNYAWLHYSRFQPAVEVGGVVYFPETTLVFQNNDFGDGNIGLQYSIIEMNALSKQELKIGSDLGIPWGPDQKNGTAWPKNVQTGSGAYTIGGFLSYSKAFPAQHLSTAATAAGRIKFKNRRNEKPGNEANILLTGTFGPFWKTRESVSLNYKITGVTLDANGDEEPSSRGSRIDLLPAFEFTFTESINATFEAEFPVWRDAYQKQYGNTIGARVSLLIFFPVLGN